MEQKFLGPKIWSIIPNNIQNSSTIKIQEKYKKNGNQVNVHVAYAKPTYLVWALSIELTIFLLICNI